jgi:ankyrin repeat protein
MSTRLARGGICLILLLEAGASVNLRTREGETAPQAAHDHDHNTAERLIRDAGGTH